MNLVSIQGRHAPGMQFKGEEIHVCHQLMRGLADTDYLVINSTYRTDILYRSPHEKNQSIMRLWCLYKGKNLNGEWIKKFFRSTGSFESLQYYFTRLQLLSRIPAWYNLYMKELDHVLANTEGEIPTMIKECLAAFTTKGLITPNELQPEDREAELEFADTLSIVSDVVARHNSN